MSRCWCVSLLRPGWRGRWGEGGDVPGARGVLPPLHHHHHPSIGGKRGQRRRRGERGCSTHAQRLEPLVHLTWECVQLRPTSISHPASHTPQGMFFSLKVFAFWATEVCCIPSVILVRCKNNLFIWWVRNCGRQRTNRWCFLNIWCFSSFFIWSLGQGSGTVTLPP